MAGAYDASKLARSSWIVFFGMRGEGGLQDSEFLLIGGSLWLVVLLCRAPPADAGLRGNADADAGL